MFELNHFKFLGVEWIFSFLRCTCENRWVFRWSSCFDRTYFRTRSSRKFPKLNSSAWGRFYLCHWCRQYNRCIENKYRSSVRKQIFFTWLPCCKRETLFASKTKVDGKFHGISSHNTQILECLNWMAGWRESIFMGATQFKDEMGSLGVLRIVDDRPKIFRKRWYGEAVQSVCNRGIVSKWKLNFTR